MHDTYRLYRGVCRVFAIAFTIVFVWLMTLPGLLARAVTGTAGLVGLGGEITIGAGDLDHVLALSLMGCITALAWFSARRPERLEPYVGLLTAKVISTAGFTYLALVEGGAWTLPAVADGTVIAGLVFARSLAAPDPRPRTEPASSTETTASEREEKTDAEAESE